MPLVGEDSGDDKDDLGDSLELAQLTGLDGEALGRGDRAQAGDQELAANDDDGDPNLDNRGVVSHQRHQGRGDHELVGQRVEKHAHGSDLAALACKVAVEAVCAGGEYEESGGAELLQGRMTLRREKRREYP